MILGTIVKAVKRKAHRGDQAITADQITTDIIACINETIREVQKLLPKRFWLKQSTFPTVLGTQGVPALYSLPSDLQDLSMITYFTSGTYWVVQKIFSDQEWLKSVWNPVVSINKPRFWREIGPDLSFNKQIELFPVPDGVYTLNIEYYKLKSNDFTSSDLANSVTDIPDQYQDVIEKGALYKFLKGFDDPLQEIANKDYMESKLDLEMGDERNSAGDLRMRFGTLKYELPGFRLE